MNKYFTSGLAQILSVFFLVVMFQVTVLAEEVPLNSESKSMLIRTCRTIKRDVESVTRKIDDFFVSGQKVSQIPETKYKLRFELFAEEDGRFDLRPRINTHIFLPNLENRLAFVLNNYSRDILPKEDLKKRTLEEQITAGFRYYFPWTKEWTTSFGYGLRFHGIKPVIYSRFDFLRHCIELNNWLIYFQQNFFWYSDDGAGELTQIDFDRPLNDTFLFRTTTSALWSRESDGLELEQAFLLSIDFKKKERMIFIRTSVSGHKSSELQLDNYSLDITYRTQLGKPWLYFYVTPQLEFPREENFKDIPSIRLGVELFF